jgi:hypothetical protein
VKSTRHLSFVKPIHQNLWFQRGYLTKHYKMLALSEASLAFLCLHGLCIHSVHSVYSVHMSYNMEGEKKNDAVFYIYHAMQVQ